MNPAEPALLSFRTGGARTASHRHLLRIYSRSRVLAHSGLVAEYS